MKLEILRCRSDNPQSSKHLPILFVHGSFCGAWVWSEFWMPYFASRGFSSQAVSLRGHGESEGNLSLAGFAHYLEDVKTAIAAMGEPLVLVGHSMGGLLVQHLLGSGCQAIKGAVLLASTPPSGLSSSAAHLATFSPDVLWQLGMLQSLGSDAVSANVIHRALFSPDTPREEVARFLPRLQRESQVVSMELMTPPWPRTIWNATKPPVLVLGGDADVLIPPFAFHEAAVTFSGDIKILNGAPHGLMMDATWWRPSADAVIDWLEKKSL